MSADADPVLAAWFKGLQEQDRATAPAFERMVATAPRRHPGTGSGRGWAAGGLALAAGVLLFSIAQRPAIAPEAVDLALPAWQSPTDFLLASPDASLQRLGWTTAPTAVLLKRDSSAFDQPSLHPARTL